MAKVSAICASTIGAVISEYRLILEKMRPSGSARTSPVKQSCTVVEKVGGEQAGGMEIVDRFAAERKPEKSSTSFRPAATK